MVSYIANRSETIDRKKTYEKMCNECILDFPKGIKKHNQRKIC